jgi:hypothetical protein
MIIEGLIKELIKELIKNISDICLSYLTEIEQIYVSKNWNKYNKYDIYDIAIDNGWLDLLIWVVNVE